MEQTLILPTKREVLLTKLNSFKTESMTAKEKVFYDLLTDRTSRLFIQLCWSKLGVSRDQLKKLPQEDLNELAQVIYEQSVTLGLIQNIILVCTPIAGWIILGVTKSEKTMPKRDYGSDACYLNMRYGRWYRKIKKISGKNFNPDLKITDS